MAAVAPVKVIVLTSAQRGIAVKGERTGGEDDVAVEIVMVLFSTSVPTPALVHEPPATVPVTLPSLQGSGLDDVRLGDHTDVDGGGSFSVVVPVNSGRSRLTGDGEVRPALPAQRTHLDGLVQRLRREVGAAAASSCPLSEAARTGSSSAPLTVTLLFVVTPPVMSMLLAVPVIAIHGKAGSGGYWRSH